MRRRPDMFRSPIPFPPPSESCKDSLPDNLFGQVFGTARIANRAVPPFDRSGWPPVSCFLQNSGRHSKRPHRLARPRTSPFHGGNGGSNPPGDAIQTEKCEENTCICGRGAFTILFRPSRCLNHTDLQGRKLPSWARRVGFAFGARSSDGRVNPFLRSRIMPHFISRAEGGVYLKAEAHLRDDYSEETVRRHG